MLNNHEYAPSRRAYRHTRYPFTRAEVVRRVRAARSLENGLAVNREIMFPTPIHKKISRIANIKPLPKNIGGGFHVTGIGNVPFSRGELTTLLVDKGFTGIRNGRSPRRVNFK